MGMKRPGRVKAGFKRAGVARGCGLRCGAFPEGGGSQEADEEGDRQSGEVEQWGGFRQCS